MTQKGFDVLEFLIESQYQGLIQSVTASRDVKLVEDYYEHIKKSCETSDIPFYDRETIRKSAAEFSIAISWRWIIKEASNLIVIHDSLLPKYRGFAPLINSLKNGEKKIGVTALYATDEYDKGDIIFQSYQEIEYPITIQKAIEKVSDNYRESIKYIFEKISQGESLPRKKQNDEEATYSLWLDDEDYHIDWKQSSEQIKRFIDATGIPYAGAYSMVDGEKLRILEAQIENDVFVENRNEGKILFIKNGYPIVVCGRGLIKLTKAVSDVDRQSVLPLNKFRVRFT